MDSKIEILQLVLGTGFVTTAINQLAGWFISARREKKEKHRNATYLALQIAVILEGFALECAEKLSSGNYELAMAPFSQPDLKLPELQNYPESNSWNLIDLPLANRILNFPNVIQLGHGEMTGYWNEGDRDDRQYWMMGFLGKYGLIAWDIAVELRKKHNLPEFSPIDTSWDAVECLRGQAKNLTGED